jgi:hypothetical protein
LVRALHQPDRARPRADGADGADGCAGLLIGLESARQAWATSASGSTIPRST